jgi:hypothetical protein
LLKADNPRDTLQWENFYSRLRVYEKLESDSAQFIDGKKIHFDQTSIMIALYFLTSSKAATKAQYLGALYFDYGNERKLI